MSDQTPASHPHVDPRQPRSGARPATNPPVFAWKPGKDQRSFHLLVARDVALRDIVLEEKSLSEPVYLPEHALPPGTYHWKWSSGDEESEVFLFEIGRDAVVLEVPPAKEWLRRFPATHPRIWIRPEAVEALRESRNGARAGQWKELKEAADALLAGVHEIEEPAFLPDWNVDYALAFGAWYKILHSSRRFIREALILALAYLASGDARYARPACRRMASISRWNPEGSSHIDHNDEAHMSVIWDGPQVCDWIWDQFTADEKAVVIDQFRRRGQITFEHMHDKGSYGVTRFDSHAGREIIFLAQMALVFHEEIPEAHAWLEWLRPVLCGIWPIWSGDDGAWAEGPSYGQAYVSIMTYFASALKCGAGVDLYRRPFWKGHAEWRRWCLPSYAEWMGFGDHTERWSGTWEGNANLVDIIARETVAPEFAGYVRAFREAAEHCPSPAERTRSGISPQLYLAPVVESAGASAIPAGLLRVFPDTGWAAVRTDVAGTESDVAFIFRSSPFGAVSHSHANNNDFILHVAGKVLAQPSGYYDGYGSNHHAHWNWHTKSHNCVTLSGSSQLLRSHDSVGRIRNAFEDARLAYMVGVADASYALQASRCRRHVVFLKEPRCFVLIDEFVARDKISSALEWNIHSWATFEVDEKARRFSLEREGSKLTGHFMYHHNAFFTLTEGWNPPPNVEKPSDQWLPQQHLCFTLSGYKALRNLGVVLVPSAARLPAVEVSAERVGDTEVARIGDIVVTVNQGKGIPMHGGTLSGVALIRMGNRAYEISDEGVRLS